MLACDFPGAIEVGKPENWDESKNGPCLSIYVLPAKEEGVTTLYSVYQVTPEELKALNEGGVIRLGIVCADGEVLSHPVFKLGVLSPEDTATIDLQPRWSLGGVIYNSPANTPDKD